MDDKDWRILKMLAEERNITKAAARLFISQPALTYRLKNIEEEFDIQVVSRGPNGVSFTPQGEYLLAYASEMLRRLGQVKEQLKNMENTVQGALRLGASTVFANYHLPGILKGFLELYPDVDIQLRTGLSYQVVNMLEEQEITLAIVRGDHDWSKERILLKEEPVCIVSRTPLEMSELLQKPHIRYGTDTSLQKMVEDWWKKNFNAQPKTTMEVTTMDTARQLVLHGLGWTILPSIGLSKDNTLFTQALFWPDGRPVLRQTWALCSNEALELQTVRVFLSYLKNDQLNGL
ncbi:MAG: LysR family transcriptional regulator [Rhodocyclales bacterium GT-UBC]|nr:MAG: LysR family transcriptional regulator [Rhodocyclales bacterium GT-UBC]